MMLIYARCLQLIACVLAGFLFTFSTLYAQAKGPAQITQAPLSPAFKSWFDMVAMIASNEEKQAFLKLNNDTDRAMFINFFWQQRDPTPGTRENEYKNEIEKRFQYVNTHFQRGTNKPGWLTDMGRMYMILGEPKAIETIDVQGVFPAQIWSYSGDASLGLPPFMNLIFFKRYGSGEWVLYDPVSDGPAALMMLDPGTDTRNNQQIYMQLRKLAPTLCSPALSIVPSQAQSDYAPGLGNNIVMANIVRSPSKKINPDYATNFIRYKGFVHVDTSLNFIDSSHDIVVLPHERWPVPFVAFAVKPKKIAVAYSPEKDKYYYNFAVTVSVRQNEQSIYQYSKNFDCYMNAAELDVLKNGGATVADFFPLIPGRYTVLVFVQNQVAHEFSYFEKELIVPGPQAAPQLGKPVLGARQQENKTSFSAAFQYHGMRLSPDCDHIFGQHENPLALLTIMGLSQERWQHDTLAWSVESTDAAKPFSSSGSRLVREQPFHASAAWIIPLVDKTPPPGFYRATVRLLDQQGSEQDRQTVDFSVSTRDIVPRPTELYNEQNLDNSFFIDYVRGTQFRQSGQLQAAASSFYACATAKIDFCDGQLALMETRLALKQFADVLATVQPTGANERQLFAYFRQRGDGWFGLGKHAAALAEYQKALDIYNGDYTLFNRIGQAHYMLDQRASALAAFETSLKINSEQPELQKLIAELKSPTTKK